MILAEQDITAGTAYMMGSVAAATAFLTLWITREFSKNRRDFYRVISRHNREDDDRFESISTDIWSLRLRNALKDGEEPPSRRTFSRRRYLVETPAESDDELDGARAV